MIMIKKILFGFAAMAIAATVVWNVNFGSQTKGMSDLSLSNVEALADEIIIIGICCTTNPIPVVCFWINGTPGWSGYIYN